jgi:hypothetical protein
MFAAIIVMLDKRIEAQVGYTARDRTLARASVVRRNSRSAMHPALPLPPKLHRSVSTTAVCDCEGLGE